MIEQGTHEELMLRNGQYADLFGLQAALYQIAHPCVFAVPSLTATLPDTF